MVTPRIQSKSQIVTNVASPGNFTCKSPTGPVAPFLGTALWKLPLRAPHSPARLPSPEVPLSSHCPPLTQSCPRAITSPTASPPGASPPGCRGQGGTHLLAHRIPGITSALCPLTPHNSLYFPSSRSTAVRFRVPVLTLGFSQPFWHKTLCPPMPSSNGDSRSQAGTYLLGVGSRGLSFPSTRQRPGEASVVPSFSV